MAGERLPARFSLRSQFWFRWTGKCFETATSHMQTVVCNTKRPIDMKKTSSYLKYTFGAFRLFQPTYEIEGNKSDRVLYINKPFGDSSTIPLQGVRSQCKYGKGFPWIVRNALNIGNLDISGSFGRETLKRVVSIRQFKDAIDGKFQNEDKQEETPKISWWEINNEVRDEKILFPTIPRILYNLLQANRTSERQLIEWKVKNGEYVNEGDILVEFKVSAVQDKSKKDKRATLIAAIKAPLDGKVNIENNEVSDWPEFRTLDGIDSISEVVLKSNKNIWFSFQSKKIDGYPYIGTERLIANTAYKDLVYYLFFTPNNKLTADLDGTNANKIILPENVSDENPEKIYVYLQAFADFKPRIQINGTELKPEI